MILTNLANIMTFYVSFVVCITVASLWYIVILHVSMVELVTSSYSASVNWLYLPEIHERGGNDINEYVSSAQPWMCAQMW